MSKYYIGPEVSSGPDFDPVPHLEAMHQRNFVNGRLNEDYLALVGLRESRFYDGRVDPGDSMRRNTREYKRGMYRYQDVIAITRTDQAYPNMPEQFSLHTLGTSPIKGLGRLLCVNVSRATSFEPRQQVGVDLLRVVTAAPALYDSTVRCDYLTYMIQDMRGDRVLPELSVDVTYEIRQGSRLEAKRTRDINDPETLQEVHQLLDIVSILAAELGLDTHMNDIRTPE